jgi:hypothetical protein
MKLLTIIGIFFSCAAFAQEKKTANSGYDDLIDPSQVEETPMGDEATDVKWSWKSATKIIKVNPLEICSVIPTLAADLELSLPCDFMRLQTGAGFAPDYIQFMSGGGDSRFDQMNGYNLRIEPRFFLFTGKHHYLSTEVYFRHFIIKDVVAVGMEPTYDEWNIPTFAYFINTDMLFHRFNGRLTFKYGMQHTFRNGFTIEGYTGLSLRKTNVISNSEYPEGGVPRGSWNGFEWNLVDGHTNQYFTPVMGIKLGLQVNRKK